MALTGNEKDFLARYGRADMPAEHLAAYRDCKCLDHDHSDSLVKKRIAALVEQEDAKAVLAQQDARRNLQRMLAQRELDRAEADVQITAAKARQIALEALTEAVLNESAALAIDPAKSLQGLSRATDSVERLTRNGLGDDEGMSEAEARAAWEAERAAAAAAKVPVKDATVLPMLTVDPSKPIGSA